MSLRRRLVSSPTGRSGSNRGTRPATFTVTRTGSTGAFSVNYATANGTPRRPATIRREIRHPQLCRRRQQPGPCLSHQATPTIESNETFFLNLSNATKRRHDQRCPRPKARSSMTMCRHCRSTTSRSQGQQRHTTPDLYCHTAGATADLQHPYATANSTATTSTTIIPDLRDASFAAGVTRNHIGDHQGRHQIEPDQTFFVNSLECTNGRQDHRQPGRCTILNDDGTALSSQPCAQRIRFKGCHLNPFDADRDVQGFDTHTTGIRLAR